MNKTHPPAPSHLIRPAGTFSPHPPFGHLLLKEKEKGIYTYFEKEKGIYTCFEKEKGIFFLMKKRGGG